MMLPTKSGIPIAICCYSICLAASCYVKKRPLFLVFQYPTSIFYCPIYSISWFPCTTLYIGISSFSLCPGYSSIASSAFFPLRLVPLTSFFSWSKRLRSESERTLYWAFSASDIFCHSWETTFMTYFVDQWGWSCLRTLRFYMWSKTLTAYLLGEEDVRGKGAFRGYVKLHFLLR